MNKIGGENNRKRIEEIRSHVGGVSNGKNLLKAIKIVTTGAIVPVVDYLGELKKEGFDEDYMTHEFDEILNNFGKYSIFVKATESEHEVFNKIEEKMLIQQKLIMVFSYGSAKINTTKAVAKLLKNKIYEPYFYESKNNKEGEKDTHSSTFRIL